MLFHFMDYNLHRNSCGLTLCLNSFLPQKNFFYPHPHPSMKILFHKIKVSQTSIYKHIYKLFSCIHYLFVLYFLQNEIKPNSFYVFYFIILFLF
jgi:hypothetical protein